jgi:hypothetical protein
MVDLLNKGFIVNRSAGRHRSKTGRTFIVTGLHRSGTSLVAAILRQAGLFIGTAINDIVYEDEEIASVLASGNVGALKRIISERDANYRSWGFKLPMLCLDLFSNPHVIVTFRDPVSMSVRASLSEYREATHALREVMHDLNALIAFIDGLRCPSLLLSYEKALTFPQDFVVAITGFCGIPQSIALRERLIGVIEPNRTRYIEGARRRYEGTIEGVVDGCLYGWCHLTQSSNPVALEVFVDERPMVRLTADMFRQDLLDAGIGQGRHGFSIALNALHARPDAVIRIRVADHDIELDNSGKRLRQFYSRSATAAR